MGLAGMVKALLVNENPLFKLVRMQKVTSAILLNPIRSHPEFVELIRLDHSQMSAA